MPTYTEEYVRDLDGLCKEISSINSEETRVRVKVGSSETTSVLK